MHACPSPRTDAVEQSAKAIDGVLAQLTAEDLVELNRQSVVDQTASAEIAKGWLTEKGLV